MKARLFALRLTMLRPICFNPRAREGATLLLLTVVFFYRFNPRAREGATAKTGAGKQGKQGFNPRAREGATVNHFSGRILQLVSIHAPVKARLYLRVI